MKKNNVKSFIILSLIIIIGTIFLCINYKGDFLCENSKDSITLTNNLNSDSLIIAIRLPPRSSCEFNFLNDNYDVIFSVFDNNTDRDTVIVNKHIMSERSIPVLYYGAIVENKSQRKYNYHEYIITKKTTKLNFVLKNDNEIILEENSEVLMTDELIANYEKNIIHFLTKRKPFYLTISYIDSLYKHFNNKYALADVPNLNQLNKIYYIRSLQKVDSNNKEIEKFIMESSCKNYLHPHIISIFQTYIKSKIDNLPFTILNEENYSENTIELFAIAIFKLLKEDKDFNFENNLTASRWLKTTKYYKKNKFVIDKVISPIRSKNSATKISELTLIDEDSLQTMLLNVVKENPSEYYLIDFWATWCKPCIEGMEIIQNMNLPSNVKLVYLSIDKPKKLDEWRKSVIEKNHDLSFIVDSKKPENNIICEFLQIKSIPRYILIDNKMNIINESYLAPHEPGFLAGLQNIKQY